MPLKIFKPFVDAWAFAKKMFSDAMKAARQYSGVAVEVTAKLKDIVENPLLSIAVGIIPGDVDNEILYLLRKVVPAVAMKMAIAHNILHASDSNSDAVAAIVDYLKTLNPDARVGFWITFAGELNIALADGKISIDEAVILTQLAYKELKK